MIVLHVFKINSLQIEILKRKNVRVDYFDSLHRVFNTYAGKCCYQLSEEQAFEMLQDTGNNKIETGPLSVSQYFESALKTLRMSFK